MHSFGALNYAILIVYLGVVFAVGVAFAGRQRTTEDYFLAGRRMPWLVVAVSMFASITSATSYLGLPGRAFAEDCSFLMMGVASLLLAPVLVLLFYPFYRRLGVTTSFEYIDHRFGPTARLAISGLWVLARLGWLGVVVYSPALAISVATGLNLYLAILLMGLLAVAYTVIGGLAAVLWTDLLQFVVLVGGAVWVAVTLCGQVPGGAAGILRHAGDNGHLFNWDLSLFEASATLVLFSYFLNFMQDFGADQMIVQRLMSVDSYRGMAKAIVLSAVIDLLIVGLLLFMGLGLFAYYGQFPDQLPEGYTGDRVLPHFIMHALPTGASGLLITALFAAAMSSMDSGINSLATVVVNDFVRPRRRIPASDQHDIRLARWLTVLLGGLAMGMACYAATIEHVLKAALTFLGLFSGPILALFLLGMLTRRANFAGWCVAAVVAIAATIWLQNYRDPATDLGVHYTYYFPFCFGISLSLGWILSLLRPGPEAAAGLTVWNANPGD